MGHGDLGAADPPSRGSRNCRAGKILAEIELAVAEENNEPLYPCLGPVRDRPINRIEQLNIGDLLKCFFSFADVAFALRHSERGMTIGSAPQRGRRR